MNLRVFLPVTKADFYRFVAREPEGRYEFEGGRIVQQMPGATRVHQRLLSRIEALLRAQLDAAKWEPLQDWGIETALSVRYGDVVVSPTDDPGGSRATLGAALIVEVLSPSSLARDLDVKPAEYMGLASLQAYIVASQTEAACLAWVRQPDGRFPPEPTEYQTNGVIAVPGLGIALSVAEIYRGIELSSDDSAPQG